MLYADGREDSDKGWSILTTDEGQHRIVADRLRRRDAEKIVALGKLQEAARLYVAKPVQENMNILYSAVLAVEASK